MAKPHRSPLLGYNHNVGHLGHVFHVQTEDSGPAAPRLFTHMFYEGTILVSRKVEYEATAPDDKVRGLMQAQHRSVIKEMTAGAFNDRIVAFFRARGVTIELPAPPAPVAVEEEPVDEKAARRRSTVREKVSFLSSSPSEPAAPVAQAAEPVAPPAPAPEPAPEAASETPAAPRRAGWWSRRFGGGE